MEDTEATIDFEKFLKNIGGLDNGYFEKYHGTNFLRKILFNITAYFLRKLPYNIRRPKNPFRSMIKSRYYFTVRDGWLPLIKKLITEAISVGWNKEVCQVKEKYGGLRFYINGASQEVHDIIVKYENLSYEICEICGESGKERKGGWIETLCDKHYEEKLKNK